METILINLGYGLMLGALLARDILWLRLMLLIAQCSLATYGWVYGNTNVALWNTLFVMINSVQIVLVLFERRPVQLDETQELIYKNVFSNMTRRDFLVFWEMGVMKEFSEGTLVREGDEPEELLLLVEGQALVKTEGRTIARLEVGQFIAEMSFLSAQPASADVTIESTIRYLSWSQQKLHSLRMVNPRLFMILQGLLGKDLARKIRALNEGPHD